MSAAEEAQAKEAPETPAAPEMTVRFLKGCDGDEAEARRRFAATWAWRVENNMADILSQPEPKIDTIKRHFPHALHGRSKDGHLVYCERLGDIDIQALRAEGVTVEKLLKYYVKLTDFIWRVVDTREEAKLCSILDLRGVTMGDITADVKTFLKSAASTVSAHYVERSYKIFVIGVPTWFSWLWAIVKTFLHENTRRKVHILGRDFHGELFQYVDPAVLPEVLGGTSPIPFGAAEEEKIFLDHIHALNEGRPTTYVPVDWPARGPLDQTPFTAPRRDQSS